MKQPITELDDAAWQKLKEYLHRFPPHIRHKLNAKVESMNRQVAALCVTVQNSRSNKP